MRDRPPGITEHELSRLLAGHWGIRAASLEYAPVGGGSYHWAVTGAAGGRWFVTVDDLDAKAWLGTGRDRAAAGLRAAMDTARALRERGLEFVVAPVPAAGGASVVLAGGPYAVTVFPHVNGTAGEFGEPLPAAGRLQLTDLLAAVHAATPAVRGPARTARARVALARRAELDNVLADLRAPWDSGPFGEPARALLAGAAGLLAGRLAALDELAAHVAAAPELVITHGEPHPANVIRGAAGLALIDWDTAGLAPPERDLWLVVTGAGRDSAETRRYTAATGRAVDPDALAFYQLRWALDDVSIFAGRLRGPHQGTADLAHALRALEITVAQLAARGDRDPASRG